MEEHIDAPSKEASDGKFEVFVSNDFAEKLDELGGSIVFTTYQCGKIFFVGLGDNGALKIFERTFPRAMGVAFSDDQNSFCLGTVDSIFEFDNLLKPGETHEGYDTFYAPHKSWITGSIDIHDLAYDANKTPFFCATRFNCLGEISRGYSFKPIWKPSFITEIVAEDRCHVNGFATEDGTAKYVTCVSDSNVKGGWRESRTDGGMVIDVGTGEPVAKGFSMPHSPRLYRGKLWLLNSGRGEFGWLDPDSHTFNPVAICPGFARGLAFAGDYAIVGLSEPREGKSFDGLPLQEVLSKYKIEPRCGIILVNLKTGEVTDWMTVTGVVSELFDVDFLEGKRNVSFVGLRGDDMRNTFSLGT